MMKKIYKTKRKKAEFRAAYTKIGDLNLAINNLEIEIDCFIRNENWDEAISREELRHKKKIQLLKMAKKGWDITYTANQVSGLGVTREYPTL